MLRLLKNGHGDAWRNDQHHAAGDDINSRKMPSLMRILQANQALIGAPPPNEASVGHDYQLYFAVAAWLFPGSCREIPD